MGRTKSVRFVLDEQERTLLERISGQSGEKNMSLTLRQMIRDEAERRGIKTVEQLEEVTPVTTG